MYLPSAVLLALSAAVVTNSQSPPATKNGCLYEVEGVGGFTQTATYTFTDDSGLPDGLVASNYGVGKTAKNSKRHRFLPENVQTNDGFLELIVPGGQTHGPYKCGEVSTTETHILYASVRTTAIFSAVPGTVNAAFFYHNDSQEIDIEYVTDPKSGSNPHGRQPLMLTNQAADDNPAHATSQNRPSPADRTTVAHEYRIDWIKGASIFYLDGNKIDTLTTNVPTIPGAWFWNNWSSGDPGFTVGPPKQTNIFKLQKMVLYYNTTTSQGTC